MTGRPATAEAMGRAMERTGLRTGAAAEATGFASEVTTPTTEVGITAGKVTLGIAGMETGN